MTLQELFSRKAKELYNEATDNKGAKISEEKIKQLEQIHKVIGFYEKAYPKSQAAQPPSRWPTIALLTGAFVIVSLLLFIPIFSTEVELELSATSVQCQLSEQALFADALQLKELGISDLKESVPQAAKKATGSSQTPFFNRVSGEGEMIFIPPLCAPLKPGDTAPPVVDKDWAKTAAYQGKKTGGYEQPSQIVVDPDNNLYVLDSKRHTILKFDEQGNYMADAIFSSGLDDSWKPYSMAVKSNGDLWVLYAPPKDGVGQIVVYQPDGTPGETWAGDVPVDSCNFGDYPFPSKALIDIDRDDNLFCSTKSMRRLSNAIVMASLSFN